MYLYKNTYVIQYSNNNNNDNSRVVDVERVAKGNDVLCDLWEDLKWLEYVGFRYLFLNIQHLLNCSARNGILMAARSSSLMTTMMTETG